MRFTREGIRAYDLVTVQPGKAMTVKEMGPTGVKLAGPFSAYAAACSDFSLRSVQTMRPDTLI